ncbi:dTDP-4-dehydrorhamnose reductase [Paenibacillus agaridevorans]|uniref:dTDP-4-dehydrorhamnose reductase n=1 Tax=Paenibacillus agaridevorans TaxID=171404 RepID=A0A2R5EXA0_9BACL|nr:SDR family oxidoreductase [Paenibacillus agaridevorans]GBG07994.1 dTDP-4-dehydrorhamnose reductase [Paenibacillus agaridevorans]
MTKVAVLGATGMAGHVIAMYLEEKGYEVYRMSRSMESGERAASVDASNTSAVINWLDKISADIIVNAIGILQREAEERPDIAVLINSYLPQRLAVYAKEKGIKFIHLSTDCVFSGAKGGYTEAALQDGRTMYDRSKALGEVSANRNLTFRMSILGPDISHNGTGLFHWFMNQTGKVNGYVNAIWNGVTTIELARALNEAIKQDLSGLYHLTPPFTINKYELLLLFKDIFNRNDIEIMPHEDFNVDKSLVNTRTDFNYVIPPYSQMIEEMRQWIFKHKKVYQYE